MRIVDEENVVRERLLSRWGRAVVLAVAALLCATSCSSGGSGSPAGAPAPPAAAVSPDLPDSSTYTTLSNAQVDTDAAQHPEDIVVHPKEVLAIFDQFQGVPIAKLPTTQVGSPTWVPVLAERDGWVRILLPSRPNGSTGWLDTNGDKVDRAHDPFHIDVDKSGYQLKVFNGTATDSTWKVGIGKSQYPTPLGTFFILASLHETVNTYSPLILPLSAHSDSHETFAGGPGTVAIHTWPTDDHLGKQDSDGCIRVSKDALDRISKLPLGTVVTVR